MLQPQQRCMIDYSLRLCTSFASECFSVQPTFTFSLLVLASSTQMRLYHSQLEPDFALSNKLCSRAQQLVNLSSLVSLASIPALQYLLVLAQYVMSSNQANLCSSVIVLAISMGRRLNLATNQSRDHLERQHLARIWGCCIATDAAASVIFSRVPNLDPDTDYFEANLPLPFDDRCFTANEILPRSLSTPSQMAFFTHSIKLFSLWLSILKRVYRRKSHEPSVALVAILEFESELRTWTEAIPSHLVYPFDVSNAESLQMPWVEMQVNILELRCAAFALAFYRCLILGLFLFKGVCIRVFSSIGLWSSFSAVMFP